MFFLFLESLGTTELLVILVVALVLFGPRKLPELSRSLGKSLNEFKRAGDDFKRTWEREVALENLEREAAIERAMVAEAPATEEAGAGTTTQTTNAAAQQMPRDITEAALAPVQGASVARGARFDAPPTSGAASAPPLEAPEETVEQPPARKSDWL
ncbi:MAG TPA: twin-arginine translocase TatA/TatE family subunit [Pyrinomonadaceae bacterium]|nr:twin-arginine translocase TatA/TatE family subunit [Pyrinomonadaceae bacterium]